MVTAYAIAVVRAGRVGRVPVLCCSFLFSTVLAAGPLQDDERQPESMIGGLQFLVLDAPPDPSPVRAFRYTYELFSADRETPTQARDIAYQSEDGILCIPEPYPPFGRIRIWVEVDDLERGFRHGYGSFSYRLDTTRTGEPTTIQLEDGIVVTGKVLDAKTGQPVADAEVAPMKWGHHFDWADWEESVKTDQEGKYRFVTKSAKGIEARHPEYRSAQVVLSGFEPGHNRSFSGYDESKVDDVGADGSVLQLHPLIDARGRVVDVDGKPIAGVDVQGSRSDAEGRFAVRATQEEWDQREKGEISYSFSAPGYRYTDLSLKQFSLDGETVVKLEREQLIQGQVLDQNGHPLEDCTVELKCDAKPLVSDFDVIPGPYAQGKWETRIPKWGREFTIRVSVAGSVRSLMEYTLEEVTRGPIISRLSEGHRLSARLVARVPLDEKNTPVVLLSSTKNERLQQQARVQADGRFAFAGLADGQYSLQLYPAICTRRGGGTAMNPGVGAFSTFGFESPNKPWEKMISVQGTEMELDPIDLHEAGLLPGRVTGIAYNPAAAKEPFANAFGYVCAGDNDFNSVGGSYYLLDFMTDADGRFQIDPCPPGKYVLRLSDTPGGYGFRDPSVWIHVISEKTIDVRLFAPGAR